MLLTCLLQGDSLSVVILNCVLIGLIGRLADLHDLSVFAFADDLTVASSSWISGSSAFSTLQSFCSSTDLVLNLSKCQLWTKGEPTGSYPIEFDQVSFRFNPFLLGAPIDIDVSCGDVFQQHNETTLYRANRIATHAFPYQFAYRLFVSLVSSCYNHFALACNLRATRSSSLKHAGGFVVNPSTPLLHLVIYFPLTFFSIIATSSNIFFMFNIHLTCAGDFFSLFGVPIHMSNGDLFIAYVMLLNLLVS